jgi:hypothetical protein
MGFNIVTGMILTRRAERSSHRTKLQVSEAQRPALHQHRA